MNTAIMAARLATLVRESYLDNQMNVADTIQGMLDEWIAPMKERVEKAEAAFAEMREAIQALLDEQNGPPLLRRENQWNEAVEAARKALSSNCGNGYVPKAQVWEVEQRMEVLIEKINKEYFTKDQVKGLVEALQHIAEYWNGAHDSAVDAAEDCQDSARNALARFKEGQR